MPDFAAVHLLVSATPPTVSDDFTILRSPLAQGFPAFIDLTTGLRLKATLPTGLMQAWLDADPSSLVASSDDELQARPAGFTQDLGGVSRSAFRLALVQGGSLLSTMPVAVAARHGLPDAGDPAQGVAVDIVPIRWSIFAGTLGGPGDFGSFIELGWKIANLGLNDFHAPAINPFLQRRLAEGLKMSSELGLVNSTVDTRFAIRRAALDVTV